VHCFTGGKPSPIGILVLEQDIGLLEALQLCSGDMIMQFNGCDLQNIMQNKMGWQESAPEKHAQLQVLRSGVVINLLIE